MTTTRQARHGDERGTASLEVVLVLPVIIVIYGLIIVMAHAYITRIRLEGATHLAALSYSTQRGEGKTHAEATQEARLRVESSYFPASRVRSVTVGQTDPFSSNPLRQGDTENTLEGGDTEEQGMRNKLLNAVLPFANSRQRTTVKITMTPTHMQWAFPETEATSTLVMDFTPWTFDEWGILGQYANDIPVVGGKVTLLLWPLGFVGDADCLGGNP